MKTIAFLFLFLFCFSLTGMAQKPYSVENLQTLSQEELELYMVKAKKLQNTGKIINIVGASILGGTTATIMGMAIFAEGDWSLGAVVVAFFGGLAGVGTLAVGIPMNLTGKNRVKTINSLNNAAFHRLKLEIMPGANYNQLAQKYQASITLRLSF